VKENCRTRDRKEAVRITDDIGNWELAYQVPHFRHSQMMIQGRLMTSISAVDVKKEMRE
jgi:hypothetical protein